MATMNVLIATLTYVIATQKDSYRFMLEEGYNPKEAAAIAFQQDVEPHLDRASSSLGQATIPRLIPASQTQFFSMLEGYPDESFGTKEDATHNPQ
jgi:hypothetical protein